MTTSIFTTNTNAYKSAIKGVNSRVSAHSVLSNGTSIINLYTSKVGPAAHTIRTDELYVLPNPNQSTTTLNIFAYGDTYLYGRLPDSITTINNTASTGSVYMDQTAVAPKSLMTFTGGAGNDVAVLPASWIKDGFSANGGSGTLDTVYIPTLSYLNSHTATKLKNFELIGIGGSAAITFDIAASQITATGNCPNLAGFSIQSTLAGNVAFTVASTMTTLSFYFGVAPGATLTVPTVTTLNLILDDSQLYTKGAIAVAHTITATSATRVNLTSNGSQPSVVSLANANSFGASMIVTAAATSCYIYGSKQLVVDLTTVGATTLTTINASSMTGGGVKFNFIKGGVVTSVIGSNYNDFFKVNTGTLASTLTLTAGTGTKDTLSVITQADLTTAANLSNTSGFEILDLGGTAGAVSLTNAEFMNVIRYNPAITSISTNAAIGGALGLAGVPKQVNNLTIAVTPGFAITWGYNGGNLSDALTVNLDDTNAAALGAITVTSLVAAGIGTLTINSTGSAAHTVTAMTVTNLQDLYITGDKSLTLSAIGAVALNFNIDASGMTSTAALSMASGAISGTVGRSFIGSKNADTLDFTTAVATAVFSVKGGGGADIITNSVISTSAKSYVYTEATDGGSNFGEILPTKTSLLVGSGDQLTHTNVFTTAVDKIVIGGNLKTAIANSQSGIIMSAAAPAVARAINFSVDKNAIILQAAGAAADMTNSANNIQVSKIYSPYATTTFNTITNEAIGVMRILAIPDPNTGFAIYAYKCITADNAITADEVVLLAYTASGALAGGTCVAGDFLLA